MKKIIFTVAMFFAAIFAGNAQKYAYVDTQYILDNMQEYKDAQAEIDQLSIDWQKELEKKFGEIDKMYKQFQVDAVLLPEDTKKKREDEIVKAEKEAKDLQKKRFGKDGDLFKKRQELIKPIQDKVFNAISEYAREKNYSFVFDKAGALTIVYADSKLDLSEEVLQKMGITPQQNNASDSKDNKTTTPKAGKK